MPDSGRLFPFRFCVSCLLGYYNTITIFCGLELAMLQVKKSSIGGKQYLDYL